MSNAPAVFLDRDGTLIEDVHYCKDPALVRVLPGAVESLQKLKEAGYRTVIITNQSAIGRGWMTHDQYEAVHRRTMELIGDQYIDATYFCSHSPEEQSSHRKPAPGMVLDAASHHGIDLSRSWFIGDKRADVLSGKNAGTRSILVLCGQGKAEDGEGADFIARDLAEATEFILKSLDASPR
jgi:D-glycero-D-manno-heptose 1,7-bisphosphate phosphatase